MSSFWSIWVTVITLASIAACFVLLRINSRNYTGVEEGEQMPHTFDGISELNNPLPKWWSWLFILTIVFGVGYLLLFPGLGNFKGFYGWTSSNQTVKTFEESQRLLEDLDEGTYVAYSQELAQAKARYGSVLEKIVRNEKGELIPVEELAMNSEALKVGQRLFGQNCSQCHGSDARGSIGFPDLTDNAWLYGGSGEAIVQSLLYGRQGNMAAWGEVLGEEGVRNVTSYVLSLSGRKVNFKEASAGKASFTMCAACHGADGKGNYALGAPDLTDNIWLYGSSRKAVEETVTFGRNGIMPAWKDILGEDKVQLLAAYVWRLSNPDGSASQ